MRRPRRPPRRARAGRRAPRGRVDRGRAAAAARVVGGEGEARQAEGALSLPFAAQMW